MLEGWKVYAGTNNLHQLPEAASIAQIIINSNYTDEQDDYDIALMRLSKPLTLSSKQIWAPPFPGTISSPWTWQCPVDPSQGPRTST